MRTKTQVLLIAAFLLVFGAGAVVGMVQRFGAGGGAAAGKPPRDPHSWIAEELQLSTAQRDQMEAIWSEVMKGKPLIDEKRKALGAERDEAIRGLLTESQREQYDAVLRKHADGMADLHRQREKLVEDAIARTKQILSAKQSAQYDQILARMREHRQGRNSERQGKAPPATGPSADASCPSPLASVG